MPSSSRSPFFLGWDVNERWLRTRLAEIARVHCRSRARWKVSPTEDAEWTDWVAVVVVSLSAHTPSSTRLAGFRVRLGRGTRNLALDKQGQTRIQSQ